MNCQSFQSPSIQQLLQCQNSFQKPKKTSSLNHTEIKNLFIATDLPIFDLSIFKAQFSQNYHTQLLLKLLIDWNKDVRLNKKKSDCRSQLARNRFIFKELRNIQRKPINQRKKYFNQLIYWFNNVTKASQQNPYYPIKKKSSINQENQIRKKFATNTIDIIKSYRRKELFENQSSNLKESQKNSSKLLKQNQNNLNRSILSSSVLYQQNNKQKFNKLNAKKDFTQNLRQIFYRKESEKIKLQRQLHQINYLQNKLLRDKSIKKQRQLQNYHKKKINNQNNFYSSQIFLNKKFNLLTEHNKIHKINDNGERKLRLTCRQRFFKLNEAIQLQKKQSIDCVTGINLISSSTQTPKNKSKRKTTRV